MVTSVNKQGSVVLDEGGGGLFWRWLTVAVVVGCSLWSDPRVNPAGQCQF